MTRVITSVLLAIFMVLVAPAFVSAPPPKDEPVQTFPITEPMYYTVHQTPVRSYAFGLVKDNWDASQWLSFVGLVNEESNWDNHAQNPTSTAYGIGQFLDSTWKLVGCEKTSDPYIQLECMVKYVKATYDDPTDAYLFQLANDYY